MAFRMQANPMNWRRFGAYVPLQHCNMSSPAFLSTPKKFRNRRRMMRVHSFWSSILPPDITRHRLRLYFGAVFLGVQAHSQRAYGSVAGSRAF